jgi:Phenazine biosynthesis-like protein
MERHYVTVDVFTEQMFRGNPVAVVLDAEGLSAGQMQAIAVEFNYSETTFILPPKDQKHSAWVRIFTPSPSREAATGCCQVNLWRSEKPDAGCALTLPPLHSAIRLAAPARKIRSVDRETRWR